MTRLSILRPRMRSSVLKEDVTAVERQDGDEVQDPEVDADQGQQRG